MNVDRPVDDPKNNGSQKFVLILLAVGCGLALLIGLWPKNESATLSQSSTDAPTSGSNMAERKNRPQFAHRKRAGENQTAEEQVAARLNAFIKNRREVMHRYAEKLGVAVPTDLEKFFDAADAGHWEEVNRLFEELKNKKMDGNYPDQIALQKLFHPMLETWGAHAATEAWPAQALLDYGRDVLGSLKPDMVYLGGTDPGRFIPTFLNETSGSHAVVLTQNALADGSYLDYANFLYGDRMQSLSQQDSQNAFNQYLADVAKRSQHDRDFPDEPKQMRPGENYYNENGKANVSGQGSVMAINELLVKTLQQKNPELSFAMEESFSLPSTYEGAHPLGPLLQLSSANAPAPLTQALAGSSLDYWRDRVGELTSSPQFDPTKEAERTYAHMIVAQGNLFQNQSFSGEAEQAYRLAQELARNDVEPVSKLYDLLVQTGRANEAEVVLSRFQQANPGKVEALRKYRSAQR